MKSNGSDAGGTSVQFLVAQAVTPALQIFAGEFKRVQHCALKRGNIRKAAAEPGFGQRVLGHSLLLHYLYGTTKARVEAGESGFSSAGFGPSAPEATKKTKYE